MVADLTSDNHNEDTTNNPEESSDHPHDTTSESVRSLDHPDLSDTLGNPDLN
jgi:hypothetical protein